MAGISLSQDYTSDDIDTIYCDVISRQSSELSRIPSCKGDVKQKSSFFQSQAFEDRDVERGYLKHVAEQGIHTDIRFLMMLDFIVIIQSHLSRTNQCEEIGKEPCPVGFWIIRAVSAAWLSFMVLSLLLLRYWEGLRTRVIGRYQEILCACLVVAVLLRAVVNRVEQIREVGQSSMKEVTMRYGARCSNKPDMCPSFSWAWFQLFPWYTETDDEGNTYTVNEFDAAFTIPGYIYILLVSIQCIRWIYVLHLQICGRLGALYLGVISRGYGIHLCDKLMWLPAQLLDKDVAICSCEDISLRARKHLQELLSRSVYKNASNLLSQQSCVEALLQQYIPARLMHSGRDKLLLEEFPMVTILFCSFDKVCVQEYVHTYGAEEFFATVASIILEFDLFLELTDLFKLENVGHDYLVTSSVVACGMSSECSDAQALARDVADAAALVKVAQMMVQTATERKQAAAEQGGISLDFKVGIHSGPCVGAVAGAQRRFYRLFGDTINTAARMCSHSEFGTVQLSAATNELLSHQDEVQTTLRGEMTVKGKGQMTVYQVGTPATSPVAVVPDQPRRQRSQSLNILTSLKWMMQSPAHGHEASQDDVSGANRSLSLSLARPSPFSLQLGKRRSQMSSRELFLHIESQRILHAARIVKGQYINGKAFRAFFSGSNADRDNMETVAAVAAQKQSQFRMFTGEFADAEAELNFKASAKIHHEQEQKLLLGQLIGAMLFMHAVIYIQNAKTSSNSQHLYVLLLGGIAASLQALVLWIVSKEYKAMPQSQNLFWIVFAISCVLLVPLVFVTPVRFPLMALVLLLCHHPTYSSSSIVLGLILFCFVILYITAAVWMNESMEGIPNASLAVVILCGVLLVLRRSFFIMARQAWQVEQELRDKRIKLAGLLYDLVPSVSACKFVLEQHGDIRQMDDDSSILIRDLLWVAPLGDSACVLSTDLVNFTPLSEKLGPIGVVNLLHDLWCIMDRVLQFTVGEQHKQDMVSQVLDEIDNEDAGETYSVEVTNSYLGGMFSSSMADMASAEYSFERIHSISPFKVDTVGDAYVVAILLDRPNDAVRSCAAMKMLGIAQAIAREVIAYSYAGPHGTEPGSVAMRMGCCLGQAVSGLVGLKKPRYHVVGDALNMAAELESKSRAWNVLMDESTCNHLQHLQGKLLVDLRAPSASL